MSKVFRYISIHRYALYLSIIGILFYVINALTPYFSDDWHYAFIFEKEGIMLQRHIHTLGDVLTSLGNHYMIFNGRITPHFFIMIFAGITGKWLFNILNVVALIAFIHLLNINFTSNKNNYFQTAVIATLFTLILAPEKDLSLYWMSGACNYLWSAVFVLLFHYLLNRKSNNAWYLPLLFIYGILTGMTHEAIVVGLCSGYAIHYITNWKQLTAKHIVMLSGLFIGAAILGFAPSSLQRAHNDGLFNSPELIIHKVPFIAYYLLSEIIIVISCALMIWNRKFPQIWCIAMIVSILFITPIVNSTDALGRAFWGAKLFAIIITIQILNNKDINKYLIAALGATTIAICLCALPYCIESYNEFKKTEKQLINYKSDIITTHIVSSIFQGHFSRVFITTNECFWRDIWSGYISSYYNVPDSIMLIERDLYEQIQNNDVTDTINLKTNYPAYICKWSGSDDVDVTFTLSPSPFRNLPVLSSLRRFNTTELTSENYEVLIFNGQRYLLILKPLQVIDRVTKITAVSKCTKLLDNTND